MIGASVVGIGAIGLSSRPEEILVTYALGSCIGVSAYDPIAKVGGLMHAMLPSASLDRARGRTHPFVFLDTGLPRLLRALESRGAKRERLWIKAAGGASMPGAGGHRFHIGEQNFMALLELLRAGCLELLRHDIGGEIARTMSLMMESGQTRVSAGTKVREL